MFKKVIIFLALTSFGVGAKRHIGFRADQWLLAKPSPQEKIVGGEDAKEGEFPYLVDLRLIFISERHFCGGAILSEKVILTAAHCVFGLLEPPDKSVVVVAGKYEMNKVGPNEQKRKVKKAIPHPNYPGGVHPNDIAILILQEPLKMNKFVQPISLPKRGATFTGKTMLAGWGSISNTTVSVSPDKLQKVELPLVDYEKCQEKWATVNSTVDEISNICTGPINGTLSACRGDSGGPLAKVVDGVVTVIGLVSWGFVPCGAGFPSIYTRVSSFIDFIEKSSGELL